MLFGCLLLLLLLLLLGIIKLFTIHIFRRTWKHIYSPDISEC